VVVLVVSGRLGYSLAAFQLWLTLAVVGLKTCSMLALLLLLGRPHRTVEAGALPSLRMLVLMVASVSADFAVATLIH